MGVWVDLSPLPVAEALIEVLKDRATLLIDKIEDIELNNNLKSGRASALVGALGFLCGQRFGRLGRSKLRGFTRRQYEIGHRGTLNPQIRSALDFWKRFIINGIPREVPSLRSVHATIITYSDGEGLGGIGVAIFDAPGLERPQAGHLRLPEPLRDLWRTIEKQLTYRDTYEDIFQIEAVGPIVALTTWPQYLHTCAWMHWIDNAAAQAALVNGSSSILSGDLVAGATWELIARRRIHPWFDRVASASNPVDAISRGDTRGDWDLVKLEFPRTLRRQCRDFLGKVPVSG